MKPYHLFRTGDAAFVYHTGAGRFIRVSDAAYELLRLREAHSRDEAAERFRVSHPDAGQTLREIDVLEAEGFFEPVETTLADGEEFEKALDERFGGGSNNLVLSVASGCNLACAYCYCGVCRGELSDQGLMSEETAMQAVDVFLDGADETKDIRVTFFGGEPLLNKPVIKSVVRRCNDWAAEKGVKAGYSITTNATLIDDETARMLSEENFGLMVSLDGPADIHDRQCPARSGGGSFALAEAGIRNLMRRRKRVTVRCTMAHPAPDAMALIRYFKDFGFTRVVLGTASNPTFPSPVDFTDEDSRAFERCLETQIIPYMLAERAAGRECVYDPFDDIDEFVSRRSHPAKESALRCGACHGATAVGPDGTLYPCHRFVGMEAWAIGTLRDGPDMEKCRNFWREHRRASEKACGGCWAHRICKGPCPWEIARNDGTFAEPSRICDETRAWIRQGVYYLDKAGRLGLNRKKEKEK